MKSFIVLLLCTFGGASALAQDSEFVSGDGSELSELCIAAVTNDNFTSNNDVGNRSHELKGLACNGIPVADFIAKYRFSLSQNVTSFQFDKSNDSVETQLCYAAVTSKKDFDELKELYFSDVKHLEETILCNDLPLYRFTQRYYKVSRMDVSAN